MGYDLPAAIGAASADPDRPIICFAGDGSIMMNIQELQTLSTLNTNFKLIILDNGGYLSIKQTQSNFFGRMHGTEAFGLSVLKLDPANWKREIEELLESPGSSVIVAKLDEYQEFMPRIKSRVISGEIQTPELDDMYPHLPDAELEQIRRSAG